LFLFLNNNNNMQTSQLPVSPPVRKAKEDNLEYWVARFYAITPTPPPTPLYLASPLTTIDEDGTFTV
jgi:hypothetical protein